MMLPSEYVKKGWTQGKAARNCDGLPTLHTTEDAVSWSMSGAIEVAGYVSREISTVAIYRKIKEIVGESADSYNEHPNRTREEIIAILERVEQELELNEMLPSEYLEKGWTQGVLARNDAGTPVTYNDNDAISWCMSGAIFAAYPHNKGLQDILVAYVRRIIGSDAIADYNDDPIRTRGEVIAVMKEAEQYLKKTNSS